MSGLVNAVRVVDSEGNETWVLDSGSISAHGRFSENLQVGEVTSAADRVRHGQAFLAKRGSDLAATSAGVVPGKTLVTGDMVTVDGQSLRVVNVKRRLDPANGLWQPAEPEFQSRSAQRRLDADRAFDRMMRQVGGGSIVNADAVPATIGGVGGPAREGPTFTWSWYSSDPSTDDILDDPTHWQEKRVETPCRAWLISCLPTWDGVGNTTLHLLKNGVEWYSAWTIVLPAAAPPVPFWMTQAWYYSRLSPGDVLSIECSGSDRKSVV